MKADVTITKIWVEAVGASFQVVMLNSNKQLLRIGNVQPLQLALTEAHELGDYFNIKVTPFLDQNRRIVYPDVLRDTYDRRKLRTVEQLAREYRLDNGELNWNKILHYEWSKFNSASTGGFKDKRELLAWIMPFFMECPSTPEKQEEARAWLSTNCTGVWTPAKGGFRFNNERDATLFRLFIQ